MGGTSVAAPSYANLPVKSLAHRSAEAVASLHDIVIVADTKSLWTYQPGLEPDCFVAACARWRNSAHFVTMSVTVFMK